jgi:hypothetical protein
MTDAVAEMRVSWAKAGIVNDFAGSSVYRSTPGRATASAAAWARWTISKTLFILLVGFPMTKVRLMSDS